MTADGRVVRGHDAKAEGIGVRRVSVAAPGPFMAATGARLQAVVRQGGLRRRRVGAGPWAGHRADQDVALGASGLPDLVAATAFLVREVRLASFISEPVGAGKVEP